MGRRKGSRDRMLRLPIDELGRIAIGTQVEEVLNALKRVGEGKDCDPETVHQLRVSCRRAEVAIRIFAFCMRKGVRMPLRSTLQRVRRAAGKVRDCDVFLQSLACWNGQAAHPPHAAFEYLLGFGHGSRSAAWEVLRGHVDEIGWQHVDQLWREASEAMQAPPDKRDQAASDLASAEVAPRLAKFDATVAECVTPDERLHELRIRTKRLRYSMEVFRPGSKKPKAGGPLRIIEEFQEILGRMHDAQSAKEKLKAIDAALRGSDGAAWSRIHIGIDELIAWHRGRFQAQLAEYGKCRAAWLRDFAGKPLPEFERS